MDTPEGQPPPPAPLDHKAQMRFLETFAFHRPRVWDFVQAEIDICEARGGDVGVALIALANALVSNAQDLMEVRQALLAAGGDADVAAMMLGIERARQDADKPANAPPQKRRGKPAPARPGGAG